MRLTNIYNTMAQFFIEEIIERYNFQWDSLLPTQLEEEKQRLEENPDIFQSPKEYKFTVNELKKIIDEKNGRSMYDEDQND